MVKQGCVLTDETSKINERGLFITIEGPDGSGKSTQIDRIREYFQEKDFPVLFLREPGGTAIGEKLREIILDPQYSAMKPLTEALLYAAARAQIVEERIVPSLEAGTTVVCDRYIDSSIAYQAFGRELGPIVENINKYAVNKAVPDLTIFLMLPPAEGFSRIERDAREKDRIENASLDFHKRVFAGYETIAQEEPGRVFQVDASLPVDEIAEKIARKLDDLLKDRGE